MTKIVILGDSLSLPRPDDMVMYENTYPYLLSKEGYEVINRSKRANDTRIQTLEQNLLDDICYIKPHIIVMHLGIVDCAPRLFSRFESLVLSLLPSKLRNFIVKAASRYRTVLTKLRKITYVSKNAFKLNIEKIVKKAKINNIKVIIIKILDTNEINKKKSFNFENNIITYNEILDEISIENNLDVINPQYYSNGILADGIHINNNMHNYIAKEILKIIK